MWTFERIGEELGVTAHPAYQIYRDALKEIIRPDVDEHRKE